MSLYYNKYANINQESYEAEKAINRLKGITPSRNCGYSYTRGDSTSTGFGHSSHSSSSHYQSWCGSNGVNSFEPVC